MIVKIFIINMNTQNILKFFGSKLDVKLDSSEYYDYELSTTQDDFDANILDFNSLIIYNSLTIDSTCLDIPLNDVKPWSVNINTPYTRETCNFTVRRRTEKGWTLDFVFNRDNKNWEEGKTFYYWGIVNELNPLNFVDNNLSFSFTSEGKIMWESYRYSGYCDSGYTESYYISSGETPTLCTNGTLNDFNITIVFERYKEFYECSLKNEGGINDYITGWTVTNPLNVISGSTEQISGMTETLSRLWSKERDNRLGVLKIYLNGQPIYKIENWEEIIPSQRNSSNGIYQILGGGTTGYLAGFASNALLSENSDYFLTEDNNILLYECNDNLAGFASNALLSENGDYFLTEDNNILLYECNDNLAGVDIHDGNTKFNLIKFQYYEEPLDFAHVKHHYMSEIKHNFNITECQNECNDNLAGFASNALLSENGDYFLTEDNNILLYEYNDNLAGFASNALLSENRDYFLTEDNNFLLY